MQVRVIDDLYVFTAHPSWDAKLERVPLRKRSVDGLTWSIPFRVETHESIIKLQIPLPHDLPSPTKALFVCSLVEHQSALFFAVSTPKLRAYIEVCKGIPDYRAWFPSLDAWFCKTTARNVYYLRQYLPLLKWSDEAEKHANRIIDLDEERASTSAVSASSLSLRTPSHVTAAVVDFKFKTLPREHQTAEFLNSRDAEIWAYNFDMGTGKTKLTIDVAAWNYARGRINAMIVVCPNSVRSVWEDEIETHLPDYIARTVHVLKSTGPKHLQRFLDPSYARDTLKILVTNVDAWTQPAKVDMFAKFLASHDTFAVIDEYTRIKNHASKRTRAILSIRALTKMRRILSGTPVTQSPLDIYAPYAFLDKRVLGFQNWYAMRAEHAIFGGFRGRQIVDYRNVDALERKIAICSSRVLRDDCVDLPPKVYRNIRVELSPAQRKAYIDVATDMVHETSEGRLTVEQSLIKALRLQQITGGFLSLDPLDVEGLRKVVRIQGENPKVNALLDLVEDEPGRVIIWARFRAEIALISEVLRAKYGDSSVVEFHGGVGDDLRDEARRLFQNPESSVRFFVGQVQSGGIGLTLTAASHVVYYSNTYSLEDRMQSEDRAHRIGQTKKVTYTDIVAEKTFDDTILRALRSKKKLADTITGDTWKAWI